MIARRICAAMSSWGAIGLSLAVLLAPAGACLEPQLGVTLDLQPPQVTAVSLGPVEASEPAVATPLAPIQVAFSEPLDPLTVGLDTVMVVMGRAAESCETTGFCLRGLCVEGTCLESAVDTAFRNDANSPPLGVTRQALLHPIRVQLTERGDAVELAPLIPFPARQRYTLVLSAGLRDQASNPLGTLDGSEAGFVYDFISIEYTPPMGALVAPTAGTDGVPTNLTEVVMGFTVPVQGALPHGIWLEGTGPVAAELQRVAPGCAEALVDCFQLRLQQALAPATRHRVLWADTVTGPGGEPIPLAPSAYFNTGETADSLPPVVEQVALSAEGGCIDVGFQTDEPARATALLQGSTGLLGESLPGPLDVSHHLALDPLVGLTGILINVVDAYDNAAEFGPYAVPEVLPRLAISEVLANPNGPEPAQEFVEIVNVGTVPVDLTGWRITDDEAATGDDLPALTLPAGAVGLIVPVTFDESGGADPAPAETAVLLRLTGTTLGSGGLSNSGEPVFLVDSLGVTVSSFPGTADGGALPAGGQSVVRSLGSQCSDRGLWQLEPSGMSTPGWLALP